MAVNSSRPPPPGSRPPPRQGSARGRPGSSPPAWGTAVCPAQGADRAGQRGARPDQGQLQLDHGGVLDPVAGQAGDLQVEVGPADPGAAGHLDGGPVPAGLDRELDRAGDPVEGQVAREPQLDHPGAGDVAEGDRLAQAEAGRREACRLQALVAHAPVPRLDVGPQPGHVDGHLGAGDRPAGDGDGAADGGGAADDVVGGRDRPQPLADPVADEPVGVLGHHPPAVGPAVATGAGTGPQPGRGWGVAAGQEQPPAAGGEHGDGRRGGEGASRQGPHAPATPAAPSRFRRGRRA